MDINKDKEQVKKNQEFRPPGQLPVPADFADPACFY